MSFSQLPVEIRLQIYAELLVRSAPIEFKTKTIAFVPSLVRSERLGLHPSILRVSRMVRREASPTFYSGNRFEFPEVYLTRSGPPSAYIGPFLKQIGSHATLIRHMQIPIPSFIFYFESEQEAIFHPVDRRNLRRIQNTCTGIQTLELFGNPFNWE